MIPSASDVFDQVARRGHRLTRPRRAVIESLAAADGPACVRELHTAAGAVDLVTVYRALHWLVEMGLAREVPAGPGGERAERYELVDGAHTHHLHCDACGKMFTVPVCGLSQAVFASVQREYGFAVQDHRITFHGRCAGCCNGRRNGRHNGRHNAGRDRD
ncbi:MAG TPA: Fur family transcriptional regulator [Longimicrobium sp.]